YVPKEFAFHFFFDAIESFEPLIHHHKYNNNYTYNRTVYLLNSETFLDNGFLILKNDSSTTSPLATVFYETYDDLETLKIQLKQAEAEIQCVVSNGFIEGEIAFGQTQNPALNDYADGVDTMLFLSKYNN
ncbi:MAG: acyl-CoA reductase, partial [Bacteroidetes bacterium HGW-Bacteroidetes-13]